MEAVKWQFPASVVTLVLLTLFTLCAIPAHAEDFYPTNEEEFRVAAASTYANGGANNIYLQGNTFTLNAAQQVLFGGTTTIQGPGTIDGGSAEGSEMIVVPATDSTGSSVSLVLDQVTIQNFRGSYGALINEGILHATGCTFSANVNTIFAVSGWINDGADLAEGTTRLTNCSFVGNSSPMVASAIYSLSYWLVAPDTEAGEPGIPADCKVTLTGCTFTDNTAGTGQYSQQVGGGAIVMVGGTLTATDTVFSNNTCRDHYINSLGETVWLDSRGGAIYATDSGESKALSHLNLTRCTFTNNNAGVSGGAIHAGGVLTATDCTFTGNNCQVHMPVVSSLGGGGAIYVPQDSANLGYSTTLVGCTLSGNFVHGEVAQLGGGAVYVDVIARSPFTATNCKFSGNRSTTVSAGTTSFGGAVVSYYTAFTNCVFAGNQAGDPAAPSDYPSNGGAVFTGVASVLNCSFAGNSALHTGAIQATSELHLTNSIVWNNPTESGFPLSGGELADVTYCNIEGGWPGTGNISENPVFVDLAGGDLHLWPASPCINVGNSSIVTSPPFPLDPTNTFAVDLDGNSRIFGSAVDIGAYEVQSDPSSLFVSNATVVRKGKVITVTVDLTNFRSTDATLVVVQTATLGGVSSTSTPVNLKTIKAGATKRCTLKFPTATVPAGSVTFELHGTSSLGDFQTIQSVSVPAAKR